MTTIQADNPEIEKHLNLLIDLVEEGGGGLHSNLLISAMDGNLSVSTKEPMERGREILRLTRGVLLPEDQYIVGVRGDEFTLDFPTKTTLTTLQKKLIESMIALYNSTDKVRLHREYSFMLSLVDYPDVLDMLTAARVFPVKFKGWLEAVKTGLQGAALDRFLAETFLKTRHLGYNDHVRISNVSILMPIIDFLNHNWSGSSFAVGRAPRAGDVIVNNSQPIEGNNECFAFYGPMDSLDTLMRYDFIDEAAPVVRSIPIELEAPDGGTIEVLGNFGALLGKAIPKAFSDLSLYMPSMRKGEGAEPFKISHLLIPDATSPFALRRVLGYVLNNYFDDAATIDTPERRAWIANAEQKIVQHNIRYFQDILDKLVPLLAENPNHFGLKNVKHVADIQISKLRGYQCLELAA